jgi:glutamate dehydrogenase
LITILEQYPRDDMFQADEDELFDITLGILRLQEHQRTRLFVRRDRFDRFVSCLVFVPRDKYNTDLRQRIQKLLMQAFNGTSCEFTPLLSESPLARIQITVRGQPGTMPRSIRASSKTDRAGHAPLAGRPAAAARHPRRGARQRLLRRYGDSFPAGYREDYPARTAVRDIELMEHARQHPNGLAMNLYRPIEAAPGAFRFKVYPRRRADRAVGKPADARTPGRARRRGASLPDRTRRRRPDLDARLRPGDRRRP